MSECGRGVESQLLMQSCPMSSSCVSEITFAKIGNSVELDYIDRRCGDVGQSIVNKKNCKKTPVPNTSVIIVTCTEACKGHNCNRG